MPNDLTYHDDETLNRVREILRHYVLTPEHIITHMLNEGLLFREKVQMEAQSFFVPGEEITRDAVGRPLWTLDQEIRRDAIRIAVDNLEAFEDSKPPMELAEEIFDYIKNGDTS